MDFLYGFPLSLKQLWTIVGWGWGWWERCETDIIMINEDEVEYIVFWDIGGSSGEMMDMSRYH